MTDATFAATQPLQPPRDHSSDELAAALGQTEIATARPSTPPPTPPEGACSPEDPVATPGRRVGYWGAGVRQRLSPQPLSVAAFNRPVSGVAVWEGLHVYCVSEAGSLKVFGASDGIQVESSSSALPLTAV